MSQVQTLFSEILGALRQRAPGGRLSNRLSQCGGRAPASAADAASPARRAITMCISDCGPRQQMCGTSRVTFTCNNTRITSLAGVDRPCSRREMDNSPIKRLMSLDGIAVHTDHVMNDFSMNRPIRFSRVQLARALLRGCAERLDAIVRQRAS